MLDNSPDVAQPNEPQLVLTAIPPLLEWYGSKSVKEAGNSYLELRKLIDEGELFNKTEILLERLTEENSHGYPKFNDARKLLERKQIERCLMVAWSHWHDDYGNTDDAALAIETLLMNPDISSALLLDDEAGPLLAYISNLMTALLSADNSFPFAKLTPFPAWLAGTRLKHYFQEYSCIRQASLTFHEDKLQTAANELAELIEKECSPWLKLLVFELQAKIIIEARQPTRHIGAAARSDLGELESILNEWRCLWPDEDPIAGARFYENLGLVRRGGDIRWLLGELALEEHNQGKDKVSRSILELYTEQERQSTRRPGTRGASIQQLWTFLNGEGVEDIRLALKFDRDNLEPTDEIEIERWIQTDDPYAHWGTCPKAVFITKSFEYPSKMSYGIDDLQNHLQSMLNHTGNYTARVESFRRTFPHDQSEEQHTEWIWLDLDAPGTLNDLAFAVELSTSASTRDLIWYIHTLLKLDPVDPTASSWRNSFQHVVSHNADVVGLRDQLYRDCSNILSRARKALHSIG